MEQEINEIKKQAAYCLNCKTKPCKSACPLQNNIPDFIKCIQEEKYEEAFQVLTQTTIFEPICGRICPHHSQCEGSCVRGIKGESVHIGELEAFVGDYILNNKKSCRTSIPSNKNAKKIAIIGSGPSALACCYSLSTKGFQVAIYEKHNQLGGLLRYGIPEFRLQKDLLDQWLEKFILNENVEVHTNTQLGKDIDIEQLKKDYDKIVLAFGANISSKMGIEGEELNCVLGANELLEYQNFPDFKNNRVAVIGGGNVAMDASRTAKALGAKEVFVVYRRAEKQMPAEKKEIEDAKKEGIDFLFQTNVIKIFNQKDSAQMECVKTELIKKEGETREYPVNREGSNFLMDIDYVIMAVGSNPNKEVIDTLGLETNQWGYIKVDKTYQTSDEKIMAVGDLIGIKQTVAWAAKSGFECANNLTQ